MKMNLIGVKQIGIAKTALIGWKIKRRKMGMTNERALQIESKVMYAQMNHMPFDTIDVVSAFHIGRMIGMMQLTLREELQKEVDNGNDDCN